MVWTVQQMVIFAWFTLTLGKALAVRALAGCGKSTTIVEGIRRLLIEAKASGKRMRILATSFAKLSVNDLAAKLAPYADAGAEAKSINSLGNGFCRTNRVGKLDEDNRAYNLSRHVAPNAPDCVIGTLTKLNRKCRALAYDATCGDDLLWVADQFDLGPDDDCVNAGWTVEMLCNAAYDCMVVAAKYYHEYDFADQIYLPLRNGWARPIYDRIVIDETQDIDRAQLALVIASVKDKRGVCVVGDENQAIYGFRGADTTAITRLVAELDATESTLTLTRRCAKSIVARAKTVMPAQLADFATPDDAPEGLVTEDRDIRTMLDQVRPGDFILSRINAPLVALCLALLRRKVRAYVAGRDVGKTLLGIVNRAKAKSIEDLMVKLQKHTDRKVAKIRSDKRANNKEWLDSRLATVSDEQDTIVACADGCLSIQEVIGRIQSLFATEGEDTSAVMLATCHKAKGLEADRVWLAAGTFKIRSHDDSMVLYVAITRAKSELHFVRGFETGDGATVAESPDVNPTDTADTIAA